MTRNILFFCVLAGSCATVACDDMDFDFGEAAARASNLRFTTATT